MVDPFGEISFLTRSENRVEVLGALAEAPHTERDLVEATGISDVTVGRILEDFEERGWISGGEDGYATTPFGDLLAADYERLSDSMDVTCRLGPVQDLLPLEEMDFDLRHLTDARISDPETFEPLRAIDRWKQLLREADRVVGTAPAATATTVVAEPYHAEITAGDLEFEVVVSRAYYEAALDRPDIQPFLRDILQAGGEIYVAAETEDFDTQVAAFDDIATFTCYDDSDTLRVGAETRNEHVYEWVLDTYETYREGARPLVPEDFEA